MVAGLPSWFGRMLRGMRAGMGKTLFSDPVLAGIPVSIVVSSDAFTNGASIPRAHTDDGEKTSPAIAWVGVPAQAKSVALLVEDADSPTPSPFVHLVAWDLPGRDGALAAGACDSSGASPSIPLKLGRNGLFGLGYTAPDPPPGHGPHRYLFQVYALDRPLEFRSAPTRRDLAKDLRRCAIAKGALEGVYQRGG